MRAKSPDKENAILDAATHVFSKHGFAESQVSSVAHAAGLATGSIYLYFKSKEDVLYGIFNRMWLELLQSMQDLQCNDSKEFLSHQLECFFDKLVQNAELTRLYLNEHHRFLIQPLQPGFTAYQECVRLGEECYCHIMGDKHVLDPIQMSAARAFLFGGVRALLEISLHVPPEAHSMLRSQMLQLALSAIQVEDSHA